MDRQELIETVDHRVRLWVQLLEYGSKEILITDDENKVSVSLRAHTDHQIVSIPSIKVLFADDVKPDELANICMDLLTLLWESSLEDFCDFKVTLEMDFINRGFSIDFDHYNIRQA